MTDPRRDRWLNRTVLGVGLASLCSDVGHEMATMAMPAFLASLGADSLVLGLIEGLADALSSFAKLISGLYSDWLARRKPLAVAGYLVTALGMASFALATNWWQVLLGRVGGWVGRGARTPVRKVLLTEATTPATHSRAFGFERSLDSAGAVIGPLLAMWLIRTVGVRDTFVFTLIPGMAAALVIAFLVREKPHTSQATVKWSGSLPGAFRWFLLGVGVAGLGNFSNTLLILWAIQAFEPTYGKTDGATLAILFYVGYNAVSMLSSFVAGQLADRFPKNWVLAGGYALAAIPAAALLVPGDSLVKFAVVFGGSGLYMGFWDTVESTLAATLLPKSVRGFGFGVLATVNGLGNFLSSVAVGGLWLVSPLAAMGYVIVVSLVGAAVIVRVSPVVAQDE